MTGLPVYTQTSRSQAFDVATVKPNTSGTRQRSLSYPPGRFVALNMPLRFVIANAFGVEASLPQYLVAGGPSWIDSERFDIEGRAAARPASDGPWRVVEIKAMLRRLLEERYGLRTHLEPREMDVYALVAARDDGRPGAGLRPSTGGDCVAVGSPNSGGALPACGAGPMNEGVLRGYAMTPDAIARTLTAYVDRPVINRTGLAGTFSFDLAFTLELPPQGAPADPVPEPGTSIFTAAREQLGLRLQSARAPVDVLVIDRVERPSPD